MKQRCWLLLLLSLAIAVKAGAQAINRQNIAATFGFENNTRAGVFPAGWGGAPADTIFTDNQVVHSGTYSARIERTATSASAFSTLTATLPLDFSGRTIEWRGFLKWEDVSGFVALWMRIDGDTPALAFATLQGQNLNGTRDWTPYSISVSNVPAGKQMFFGFLLTGTGKGWVDDLQLLVDGVPVAQAAPRVLTPLDTDHEFDQGSRVNLTSLSNAQVKNLATLGRVWGFVKYHHPAITGGVRHWDYDLFRILPQVLEAADSAAANAAISAWIASLGPVTACSPCASLDSEGLYMAPSISWINDATPLGADLSGALQNIYRNRRPTTTQFYVSLATGVLNPVFENELPYGSIKLPDSGYQLLALFRYWNMVEYFYPNRDILSDSSGNSDEYWNKVLEEFIPRIGQASSALTYQQELIGFIAKINDTHANLWSSLAARPPIGPCQLPVDVRFVEGRPLVFRINSITLGPASLLQPGDLIEQLDGVAVDELIKEWRPFYADSNDAARLRDIGVYMTRGPCGEATVVVRRGEIRLTLQASRVPLSSLDLTGGFTHDLPGDTFRLLTPDIAYLKLSSVRAANSADYIRSAASTKGMIIDIRNYPSEFVVFTLGQLLISQPQAFVRFTNADITNPGAFRWTAPLTLTPLQPHYSGKVVILVDEVTQSQAEYTTMAFRTAPGALVIGSTTAGADGNVSTVPLPGSLSSLISGIGVFYPDNRPTQRVGILPDIEVRPTIAGTRAGRDELIEEAIRQINAQPASNISFSIKDKGAVSLPTAGTALNLSLGYASVQGDGNGLPSAMAIISLRQNNILVSETTVPAPPLIQNGRTYAEITSSANTGVAIANPGNQSATISFYFTDSSGNSENGTFSIPARGQLAAFLNQAPFNGRTPFNGTFTFSSSSPVAVTALRGLSNERREFLMTTLPVADLALAPGRTSLVFPHFAAGGGWSTQFVLVNQTDSVLTGMVQFRDPAGRPAVLTVNNQSNSGFAYTIPARSSQRLKAEAIGNSAIVGSVQIVPAANTPAPFGAGIFSFRNGGVTVSEAGVPAVPAGNAFRLYAQAAGDFRANAIGSLQTGIAVSNTSTNRETVTLELFNADGAPSGLTANVSVPANGHFSALLNQISEFSALQGPFQGILRVSSSAAISVIGFRERYNERRDFLITTTPAANEATSAATSPLFVPHIVDSGGYTTQFILFSVQTGRSSAGTLSFFDTTGAPLSLTVR